MGNFVERIFICLLVVFASLVLVSCTEADPTRIGWSRTINALDPPSCSSDSSSANNSNTTGGTPCCLKTGPGSFLSKTSYFFMDPIVTQVQTVSLIIFDNIVGNKTYITIIRATLILYVVIYGIMFVAGMVQIRLSDLMIRAVKIGVVLALTNTNSYQFFNKYLFKLFTTGSYQMLSIVTNPYCASTDTVNFFSYFNYVIDAFFTESTLSRLVGLIFAWPIGWIAFFILLISLVKYLYAVIQTIIAYLIAFTGIALLIALAPIFIILILFERSRVLFNNWMQAIIGFTLQPIILFAAIFFVAMFINDLLEAVFVANLWSKIATIYLKLGNIKHNLFSLYWYLPQFKEGFLQFFANLIVLYFCVNLLGQLPKYAKALASQLASGLGAMGLAGTMQSAISQKAMGLLGMDKESRNRRK